MKILVINSGSSSIKYKLFDTENNTALAAGVVEKIGESSSLITHNKLPDTEQCAKITKTQAVADHHRGLQHIVELLTDAEVGVIGEKSEISAVGHRVVHGGEDFHEPTLINEQVITAIRNNIPLAPLHNPANLTGIEVARHLFANAPQIAVFDTAFHQKIPAHAYRYALPSQLYQKYRIRRYGFHGTSHSYVANQAAQFLGLPLAALNLITLHLGNGASVAAIKNGNSIDTSMGMTPLEGLIMGTRCGDVDPAIHFYLAREANMSMQDIDKLMNKQSGLKGLCAVNDVRDILQKKQQGNHEATLAIAMYAYRIKKYIGAYLAALGSVDALIFTGGVGENAAPIREQVCQGLEALGIVLDAEKNFATNARLSAVHQQDSKIKILVVPTNEELEIAHQCRKLLSQ